MRAVKQRLADAVSRAVDADVTARDIEQPADPEHGDYAWPAMGAADGNPRELADAAADAVAGMDLVDRAAVAGPGYLNVLVDRAAFLRFVVDALEGKRLGVEERSGRVLLEFSSPNVAKPMHVGHFRNNVLGDSLRRILSFVGHDVTAENYIGDWGTQYGKLIHAYREYGDADAFADDPMGHMYELYVKFHEELADDPEMEEQGRAWAQRIEDGDETAVELWERFRDASIAYHEADYERMGVRFDRWTGESTVVDRTGDVLQDGVEQGVIEEDDDGSLYVEFPDRDLPTTVLKKADGTTLYLARDVANLKKRVEEGFDHNLYVVGAEQELHFRQLFAICDRLGIDTDGCEHLSYRLLDLPEASMSSRAGRIIRLRDVLDEAEQRARDRMEDESRVDDPAAVADAVGIGAVTYATLSVTRTKNITFDWDTILSLDGDSGPYLQYANTRAKSIMQKADGIDAAPAGSPDDAAFRLLKRIAAVPDAIDAAATHREPARIAAALTAACDAFNSFYHQCPVIQAEDATARQRRLALVELFAAVTDTGLELLGIEPLEAM